MEHPALKAFEDSQLKKDIPHFESGDTVRVNVRVIEGEKERIQAFEGYVIGRSGGGLGETFTVRKISYGVGVERTFLLHSPRIESITVKTRGGVRRAKLYYLRDRVGKGTRIRARRKTINEKFLAMGQEKAAAKTKGKKKRGKARKAAARAAAAQAAAPQTAAQETVPAESNGTEAAATE